MSCEGDDGGGGGTRRGRCRRECSFVTVTRFFHGVRAILCKEFATKFEYFGTSPNSQGWCASL